MKKILSTCISLLLLLVVNAQSVCPTSYNASATNETIFNSCNGSITITSTGGNAPLIFEYVEIGNPGNTGNILHNGTSYTFLNLCPGEYHVAIYDDSGNLCPFGGPPGNNAVTIFPAASTLSVTCEINGGALTCSGQAGMVEAFAIGNAPPFSYNFYLTTGPTGFTPASTAFDMFACGFISVEVMDATGNIASSGCAANCYIVPTVNTITTPSCFGSCNGSVQISITSGQFDPGAAPYQIEVTDGSTVIPVGSITTASQILTLNNLCADNYHVNIISANPACANIPGTNPFTIVQNSQVVISSFTSTPTSCFNACDGSYSLTITGGTPPYDISNMDCATSNFLGNSTNGLCAGNYCPEVNDLYNCTPASLPTILISEPDPLELLIDSIHHESITQASDGEIFVHGIGGNLPYTFTLNGVPSAAPFMNLPDGNYTICITDNESCSTCENVTVNTIDSCNLSVNLMITTPTCVDDCDASSMFTLTGNNGPISFHWLSGSTDSLETNLCAGTNSLYLIDSMQCTLDTTFTIPSPLPIQSSFTVTSNPCFGDCVGIISITGQGGTGSTYTYSINGEPFSSNHYFDSLCAGNYSIQVKDSLSCVENLALPVFENSELNLTIDSILPASTSTSSDGEIQVSVSGGMPPYSITANGGNLTSLSSGSYSVCLTDSLNCEICQSVFVGHLTGMNEFILNDFKIYPNPATNNVTILNRISGERMKIEFFDTKGNLVLEKIGDQETVIDLTSLKAGIYLVRLTTNSQLQVLPLNIE